LIGVDITRYFHLNPIYIIDLIKEIDSQKSPYAIC
jgi:hypothetical protein